MPSLLDTFRFTANDGTGNTTVVPTVRTLKKRHERVDQEGRTFRTKLSTPLLFRGAHYDYFRTLYDAGDCVEVTLLIERYCGGAWETWYQGVIPLRDGDYNASRCEVSFDVVPNDVYNCADKSFDKKANWLEYGTPTEIRVMVEGSEVETITCTSAGISFDPLVYPPDFLFYKGCWGTGTTTTDAPDAATAWRPISHTQDYNFLIEQYQLITTWARETIDSATPPPGDGWINISGTTWVRPLTLSKTVFLRPPTWPPPDGFFHYIMSFEAQIANQAPISNGRLLSEVLEAAVTAIDCPIDSVVSNFFNINPDGTEPTNDAYTYAENNLHNLFFFQKSDIVRASASNDATRFETTLKEFLEELKISNVWWAIVNDAGTVKLRIEHYTYFNGANGLNLVTYASGKYIAGLDRFKTKEQVPAFEQFAYQESFRARFLTQRIDYPAACVNTGSIDRSVRRMCTDFGGLVENNDAGLDGMFLMATHPDGAGGYILNTLGGEGNGAFAWENMLPALWADGRYHIDATSTVTGYTVNSVRKSRQQGVITVKWPCSESFEPSNLVNTQLGWGEVEDAEEDVERCTLKINLLQ